MQLNLAGMHLKYLVAGPHVRQGGVDASVESAGSDQCPEGNVTKNVITHAHAHTE